ncbi:hypothetical protein [Brachymonas sp.]|uniref:hypothetical protein n=1 Tax=Brachymonas sp. TaxID=1936292 RepID=UPI0035B1E6B5
MAHLLFELSLLTGKRPFSHLLLLLLKSIKVNPVVPMVCAIGRLHDVFHYRREALESWAVQEAHTQTGET